MSEWYEPKLKDIDYSPKGDELHIYLFSNEFGNVYAAVQVEDVKTTIKAMEEYLKKKKK